jgi:hypothetical protein
MPERCEIHLQEGKTRPGVVREWDPEMGDYWVCQECATCSLCRLPTNHSDQPCDGIDCTEVSLGGGPDGR